MSFFAEILFKNCDLFFIHIPNNIIKLESKKLPNNTLGISRTVATYFFLITPNFNFIQNRQIQWVCQYVEIKMFSNKILQDCNSLFECDSIILN
jgi:hypothetical protein